MDQGDNDNDDDTMQDGEPIPVEIESGGDGGNASSNAGTGPIGHSQKKTDVSSSRVVKKVRVAWYGATIIFWSDWILTYASLFGYLCFGFPQFYGHSKFVSDNLNLSFYLKIICLPELFYAYMFTF